ncbi:MAG: zinc metallopeptidase [Gammaproteobacteria bacterium TMED92]|nr:MAG: zinc metallopeptidase [Gammaproteobacteria bacterium TMED92]
MILLVAAVLALVFGPNLWVRWVMNRYGTDLDAMPGTGGELANHLVKQLELDGVAVEVTEIGDHYDPSERKVRLSQQNFEGRSLTAIAVAAHEVGHAVQHHQGDKRLLARTALVTVADRLARISAGAIWLAPIIGLITRHPVPFSVMVTLGLAGLLGRMLLHVVTLPLEWDASFGKALPILAAGNYLPKTQQAPIAKILRAAAFTYVAAALADVLNLARWAVLLRR